MPRENYDDSEILTDDRGRLWLVAGNSAGISLCFPELPSFLASKEEDAVELPDSLFAFYRKTNLTDALLDSCMMVVHNSLPESLERRILIDRMNALRPL